MNKRKCLTYLMIIGALTLAFGSTAAADEVQVDLTVEASFNPSAAMGLILLNDQPPQKILPIAITRKNKHKVTVSFQINLATNDDPVFVTAILKSTDGQLAFAPVRKVKASSLSDPEVPLCTPFPVTTDLANHRSLIENLVRTRAKRRENRQEKLAAKLRGELLERLQRYEAIFGFQYAEQLGPHLPPIELIARLSRIKMTLEKIAAQQNRPH